MRGLGGVTWQGQGFLATLPSIGMVAAFAVTFLALAAWRLRVGERSVRQGNL
jgi:hypothetical protein